MPVQADHGAVARALRVPQAAERETVAEAEPATQEIVGRSSALQLVFKRIALVAPRATRRGVA